MAIYYRQDVAVSAGAELIMTVPLKNELVYRIVISCKYDGLSEINIPNLNLCNEQENKLTIESYLDLDIIDLVDDEYLVKVKNTYGSDNEITIFILTISKSLAKKLAKEGLLNTFISQKTPENVLTKMAVT